MKSTPAVKHTIRQLILARFLSGLEGIPKWGEIRAPDARLALRSTREVQGDLFEPYGSGLKLDDEQEGSAEPKPGPTVVWGAAGSGKSCVLIERVARVLRNASVAKPVRALVVTFNKLLVDQLVDWLAEAFSSLLVRKSDPGLDAHYKISSADGRSYQLHITNLDKLPTRVVKVPFKMTAEELPLVGKAMGAVGQRFGRKVEASFARLGPAFVAREIHRVIFGLTAHQRETYLGVKRVGMGTGLQGADREVIFDVFEEVCRLGETYSTRRIKALCQLRDRPLEDPFTHVFVDECQDFTKADFEIMSRLADDEKNVFVTGDPTQSLRLGSSYHIPTVEAGRRWRKHALTGSYRLPLRICECVEPLYAAISRSHQERRGSKNDADSVKPVAKRASVLGCRPVVVYSDGRAAARAVLEFAGFLDGNAVCVFDRDSAFVGNLRNRLGSQFHVNLEAIAKIKGLERECVVWPMRSEGDGSFNAEAEELGRVWRINYPALYGLTSMDEPVWRERSCCKTSGIMHATIGAVDSPDTP